jgi:hypothetical protein
MELIKQHGPNFREVWIFLEAPEKDACSLKEKPN